MSNPGMAESPVAGPGLKRSLGLFLTVLYGLGITIGAGIYVLIGAAAARAGMHAPLSFILAALVMAPSAAAFAELSTRMPLSAGEAAYVRAGFRSDWLAVTVGFMVAAMGIISAAAVSRGSAGYIAVFVDTPHELIVVAVVLLMGAVAAIGIVESLAFAGIMTLIEVGGLLAIVGVGAVNVPDIVVRLPEAVPALGNVAAWSGVLSAALLAFFAFTGFEGLANIAEEIKDPRSTLPRAIFITLILTTLLYVAVVWIALLAVPQAELAAAGAPLSLVYERVTGASPRLISAIAVFATINGVIAFMVMASRVLHGLAVQGLIPPLLARVSPLTRTPLYATALVIALVLVLATTFPIEGLAEMTSRLTLAIFVLVNAALLLIKRRDGRPSTDVFVVPMWVPAAGLVSSGGLLVAELIQLTL